MGLDIYGGSQQLRKNNSLMTFMGKSHDVYHKMGDNGCDIDVYTTEGDLILLRKLCDWALKPKNMNQNLIPTLLYPMRGCFYGPYCVADEETSQKYEGDRVIKLDGGKNEYGKESRKWFYKNLEELRNLTKEKKVVEGDCFHGG